MKSLMFVSTEPYSGKTGLALNFILELRRRGLNPGYFKPVGNLPASVDSTLVDRDAIFAKDILELPDSVDRLSPMVLTSTETKRRLRGETDGWPERIKKAFDGLAAGKDLLIIESSGHINDGRLYGLSAPELGELLDLKVLLVVKLDNPYEIVDDVLVAADRFAGRLAGVVFNWVKANQLHVIRDLIAPGLDRRGIENFGVIPRDEALLAVTVNNLAHALGGRLLCAPEHAEDMVETFMVGAMGQEQALRFFRRKAHKAVITGGDRADVQLAALETPTTCLVLTGNYMPSAVVLSVAESKGVPVILVDMDTLTAVERTESLIGQMRVHDKSKLDEMRRRMEEYVEIEKLCEVVK